ncbi:TonB-dependent receptor plug domain-containing protein [Pseudidiomarina sp. YC-516-91]|uniref:TonB-dependent receptor plug domain-containing protein n=1 Tax=Pseudidiomarina salilacus TaxID=3384452 RepID=UPI0039851E98
MLKQRLGSFVIIIVSIASGSVVAQEKQTEKQENKHTHHHTVERITVTGSPFAYERSETASAISVVEGNEKAKHESLSLGDTLNHLAGVASISTGGQAGKPVIRGLSGNRIRVLQNGIAQDFQQYGVRHPPTVNPLTASRVDVVRGPMSVLYGADALGGVINVVGQALPIGSNELIESLDLGLQYQTNNDLKSISIKLDGGRDNWGWAGAISQSDANNFTTGAVTESDLGVSSAPKFYDTVPYTDFSIGNADLALGYSGSDSDVSLRYSYFENKQNFLQADSTPTGQILVNEHLLFDTAYHLTSDLTLHGILSWQRNQRDAGTGFTYQQINGENNDLAIGLERYQAKLLLEHYQSDNWQGQFGLEVVDKQQRTTVGQLVPDADYNGFAAFAYERFENYLLIAEVGLRYDRIDQQPANPSQSWVTNFDQQQWNTWTGSVGLSWKLADEWLFFQRLGRGFRAPSIFELYANGVHGGVAAYQQGNSSLSEEYAFNKEIGLSYLTPDVKATTTVFHNRIDDYIYQADTGEQHLPSGLPIFELRQGDATIKGIELDTQWSLTDNLVWQLTYSMLDSDLRELSGELPLMPADTFYSQLTLSLDDSLGLKDARYFIDYKHASGKAIAGAYEPFAQFDRMPFGTASTRPYNLVGVGIQGELELDGRTVNVQLIASNLLDESYRDFLDTYKGYTLGMGRNIQFQVSLPIK